MIKANLMIGSEGTLGIITKVSLKLYAQPECVSIYKIRRKLTSYKVFNIKIDNKCSFNFSRCSISSSSYS